jgi:hypothetical protein
MISLDRLDHPLSDAERAERVFAGRLLVFTGAPSLRALCALADACVHDVFDAVEPETAQFVLAPRVWEARVDTLRGRLRRDPQASRLLAATLAEVGVDPERTYRDKLALRVLPHGVPPAGGRPPRGTAFHRDTWGSNVLAQINWWAPVYRLSPRRTIVFYPYYWAHPLANTSGSWDFDELLAHRRARRPYPSVPEPTEPVDTASELPVVIEPGELLCFSGAHLHASAPNDSGRARFSLETRTVNLDDVRAGRAAPNLDGLGTRRMFGWFGRLADGAPLTDAVAGR